MLPDKVYGLTVAVSLTASVVQAFAITLQRRSHIFNDAEPPELQRSAFRRPMWVTGFLTYTIANIIGSIFTIGYLPIVVLAPVGAMNLVFNAIFAKVMLGDAFTKRTAYGNRSAATAHSPTRDFIFINLRFSLSFFLQGRC
jgi:hypothetical protein